VIGYGFVSRSGVKTGEKNKKNTKIKIGFNHFHEMA